MNFGIINSITKLHLVGISTESYYDAQIHEYQIYKQLYKIKEQHAYFPFPILIALGNKCPKPLHA